MMGIGDDGSAFVGRDAALTDLHRRHYRSLVRLACLLVDEVGSGEEVVQDAFVRVYCAWPRVDDPLKYLRAAVMNGARSGLRRRRSARRYVPPVVRAEPGADELAMVHSEHAEVLDALRALPCRQRECLVLRYYADLSEAEIASTLGISAGSVKSHSHRGMTALTVALKEANVNDDELRRVLNETANQIEEGDDSWSRLESRLTDAPVRSASRSFAFGALAIAVVVALVVTVVWTGRDDPHRRAAAPAPAESVPKRIVAMTSDRQPVVLDARSGKVVKRYDSRSYAKGTSIAVAPDGRDFYFTDGDASAGCENHSIKRFPLSGGRPGIAIDDEATQPAISPDGHYLAYYRCFSSGDGGRDSVPGGRLAALVLRDLTSGVDAPSFLPASIGENFGRRLAFAADSSHVVYESIRETDPNSEVVDRMYQVGLLGGESLPGARLGVAPSAWFGTRGVTGEYLGRFPSLKSSTSRARNRSVAVLRWADPGHPGSLRATRLFAVPEVVRQAVSDRSGNNILAVAGRTLYRWSKDEAKPTKIRAGIIAAAWIPDAPPPPDIAAVRDGRTVVLNSRGGLERDLGAAVDAGQIASAPGGKEVLVGVSTSDECGTANAPHIDRVRVRDGKVTRAASGRFPAVNRRGLVAYEVRFDGVTLGMTDLVSGMSSRSNPLGDGPGEASPNATIVRPVGWSPNGRQLLYWVYVRGQGERFYVGRLPADHPFLSRIVRLPSNSQDSVLAFVDDQHLAVASSANGRTTLRLVPIPRGSQRWTTGKVLLRTSGRVSTLAANPDGRRFLVGMFGGDLFRWTRGDARLTKVASQIETATWLGG